MASTYLLSSCPALGNGHFLQCALHLDQVQCLALDFDGGLEDCFHFTELVFVAGDEVDYLGWGLGGHG